MVPAAMHDVHIEALPDGKLKIAGTCEHCGDDIAWDHVALTDEGKLLVGHCQCPGQQHSFGLKARDQVVDRNGRRI